MVVFVIFIKLITVTNFKVKFAIFAKVDYVGFNEFLNDVNKDIIISFIIHTVSGLPIPITLTPFISIKFPTPSASNIIFI